MLLLPDNISCGYYDCSEHGSLKVSPKRKVLKYEIEFYLEDGKTTTTDDKTYEIKKNYIQIAKPGQIRYSLLPFQTAFLKFDATGEIAERLNNCTEYFCSSHSASIYNMLKEIMLLNESCNSLLLYSKILSFIDLVLSDSKIPESKNGKNYKIISQAKRYIEENYDKSIKLKDIANSVHISPIYFHNLFSDATGISPHQHLINCRIDNAKKLLWNAEIPISVIAEKTGFGCQQYLNKIFKQMTGITPAAYRKKCQENYIL